MSARTLLVLMVLFVVLGTLAIFDPLRRREKEEAAKDREEHVVWLEGKKLEGIQIKGSNPLTELLCANKEGCPFDGSGEWRLQEPLEGKADPSSAGSLASTLLNLKHAEKLDFAPGTPDPKEFGLEQPVAQVTLKIAGEKEPIQFKFGKAAAVGPNVYLSVNREPAKIFLVPNYLPEMVNKEPFHWQSKRLFPHSEGSAFNRIGWVDNGPKAETKEVRALKLKGEWRLILPVGVLANPVMIEGLSSTVAFAAAKGLWSSWRGTVEAKELLKGKPELEVQFGTESGQGHVVKLYPRPRPNQKGPREFVAVVDMEPAMLIVDASVFDRFRKPLKDYRRRTLLDQAQRASIDEARLVFMREKNEATFKLEGGAENKQWKQASGEVLKEPLSQARLNAFLDSLRDADFEGFSPLKAASPEAKAWKGQTPELSVELRAQGKPVYSGTFVVHNRGVAITENEGELKLLGVALLKQIPVRISDLGESMNKQVITSDDKAPAGETKGGEDGNDGHGNDPHAGHGH